MRGTWPVLALAGAALAGLWAGSASAQRPDLIATTELRVCADPANLPYSNDKKQGFENKVAEIIGKDLELPVAYVWFPQVVGFVRNTLGAHKCDLVMGAVAGDTLMDTTNPYYHTGYMLVTRTADHIDAHTVTDKELQGKKFGLVARTPPTDLLLRHDLLKTTKFYELVTDTRFHSPTHDMLADLVSGEIDAALLWGPIAGYAIHHDGLPLTAVFLEGDPDGPRLDYRIAMGVRAGEPEWRRRINQAITRHKPEIEAVLKEYGLETVDDAAKP